jgi:D-alanyl-D-alanine carboxypeptidase (penicillin-binding protein 5/6)
VTCPARWRHLRHAAVLTLFAVALLGAAQAHPAVLDSDAVGGAPVSSGAVLRQAAPDLYIPSGALTTADGRELWARDPTARRAMASTTKIMTAVVVLENSSLEDFVTVRKTDVKVGESGMGLRAGEQLTVRQLLEGMLIQSGNDAATALAVHVGGSVDGFVAMMNAKAAALDLIDTRYMNPHGLDVPGHYTSAEDLTALSRYAMRIPEFRRMVGTWSMRVVTQRVTHKLTNSNVMLKNYPGADGVKTGWTDEAGYCVIVSADRGGIELVATILGAASEEGRFGQATRLLDWGFAHYRPTEIARRGDRTGNVRVSDYLERTVPTISAESTTVPVLDLSGPVRRRIELLPETPAPVVAGQRLGTMSVYQGDRLLAQVPLVAAKAVPAPTAWQRILFFFARIWRGIFGP